MLWLGTARVPMCGDLSAAPQGKAPTFLVAALKDPIGANLDRIQIIKGWVAEDGSKHERVHDVAWGDADSRRPGADGRLPAVGNNRERGRGDLDQHDRRSRADHRLSGSRFRSPAARLLPARVLEIPNPRWTAYDAKYYGLTLPPEVPLVHQERAYTSPIWYTPAVDGADRGPFFPIRAGFRAQDTPR